MCGIFGIHCFDGQPVSPQLVEAAYQAQRHRGPDDRGFLGLSSTGATRLTRKSAELEDPV